MHSLENYYVHESRFSSFIDPAVPRWKTSWCEMTLGLYQSLIFEYLSTYNVGGNLLQDFPRDRNSCSTKELFMWFPKVVSPANVFTRRREECTGSITKAVWYSHGEIE